MVVGEKVVVRAGGEYQGGEIISIDRTTYSIPFYIVRLTIGKDIGQKVAVSYGFIHQLMMGEPLEHAVAYLRR